MPGGRPYPHPKEDKKVALKYNLADLPVVPAPKASAPAMPPPIVRDYPVHMILDINTTTQTSNVSPSHKYTWWTFDGTVPGPVVRCRVGDVLEVRYSNMDADGIGHNIDFHAVTGPGGGAGVTYAEAGEVKTALFKMMDPGLFIYHCAAAPLPTHVANGMYGLVLVEPEEGLPPVDKEFYVIQSEVYAQESETPGLLEHNYFDGLSEKPMYVVFNGAEGALTEKPLMVDQDDRVRIYFGNAGPNLTSSFHLIGATFDHVYREGDLVSPPARCVQTTLVPPGGSTVVEFTAHVPGNYTLLDHAIFRVDKGCVGFLKVKPKGTDRRTDIYDSVDPPNPCPGCKLHN
jgi:copper-containing nitrite reductase